MRFRDYFVIAVGVAFIIAMIISAILGDEPSIIITIVLFIITILIVISDFLEKKFPKNKISEKLENLAEWVRDNIRLN